jgi:phosphatidate cytidylyltransferase
MAENPVRSDLAVRTGSAIVLVAAAGMALWAEGAVLLLLIMLVAVLVYWEWRGLVMRFPDAGAAKALWLIFGLLYVGGAAVALLSLGSAARLMIIGIVIATDVGAYFAGRRIGGPKIAPSISPSKTWAGLGGGMLASAVLVAIVTTAVLGSVAVQPRLGASAGWFQPGFVMLSAAIGALLAVVAQIGDFFESWMKRRAGVKDSGKLIPGHGGMFDRVDGLLLVAIVGALVAAGGMLG